MVARLSVSLCTAAFPLLVASAESGAFLEKVAHKPAQQKGESCGTNGFTGVFYGNCASDLNCMPPHFMSPPGTASKCWPGRNKGEVCGVWGSTGYHYGPCLSNLTCTAPPRSHMIGGHDTCQQVCGHFGTDGEAINGTCAAGEVCAGRSNTPCRAWAGECFMYCVNATNHHHTKQQEGEWCGASGSTGYFHGECASGLVCEPDVWMPGAPNVCKEPGKKVCGSFGGGSEVVTSICGDGQACEGRASTPCRPWAGECLMYCVNSTSLTTDTQTKQQKGEWCGTSGSTGYYYGECADGLVCEFPFIGAWLEGTPHVCQEPSKKVGEECETDGSASSVYGDCGRGLACVAASPLDASNSTSSTCHQVCGSFGENHLLRVNQTCSAGQSCSCWTGTPCREWAGECYMYCC